MWVSAKIAEDRRLVPIGKTLTIGSAKSAHLSFPKSSIPPLLAQIQKDHEDHIYLKNFSTRESLPVQVGNIYQVLNLELKINTLSELWREEKDQYVSGLRELIRLYPSQTDEEILKKAKINWFQNREIPPLIQKHFEAICLEYQLESPIEHLLKDDAITDILVQDYNQIWIDRNGELQKSAFEFSDRGAFRVYIDNLLSSLEKTIDEARPFVDFTLRDGSRGHLIGPPVTTDTYCLSIRKPTTALRSLEALQKTGMMNSFFYSKIRQWISEQKNILVSGATGSGKTTFVRACLQAIPLQERLIIIEDNAELSIDRDNTVSLLSRPSGQNEMPEIRLEDLVKQSLRMRPDRIIVGEVRGEEALDLLHAMNTGHRGCFGSLHANSARDALERFIGLIQKAKGAWDDQATRKLIVSNLHYVVHLHRNQKGKREILEAVEIKGLEENQFVLESVL